MRSRRSRACTPGASPWTATRSTSPTRRRPRSAPTRAIKSCATRRSGRTIRSRRSPRAVQRSTSRPAPANRSSGSTPTEARPRSPAGRPASPRSGWRSRPTAPSTCSARTASTAGATASSTSPRARGARAFAATAGRPPRRSLTHPRTSRSTAPAGSYIADTGNGRVRRVDADGTIRTVIGTEAEPRCVTRGGDDAQALDPRRCVGVESLAADSRGNLFLATRGVAYVLGLTPAGRYGVVAGDGVAGWYEGDRRAASVRVGHIRALAVGAHDDLFVAEYSPLPRVRRIAAPAGAIGARPGSREPAPQPVCRGDRQVDDEHHAGGPGRRARSRRAAAGDRPVRGRRRPLGARWRRTASRTTPSATCAGSPNTAASSRRSASTSAARPERSASACRSTAASGGGSGDGESLGDFAEKRCGLLGGMFGVDRGRGEALLRRLPALLGRAPRSGRRRATSRRGGGRWPRSPTPSSRPAGKAAARSIA